MANSYYFGYHPLKAKHHAQMQNNRAYRLLEKTQQYWSYANLVWMEDQNFEYYYESNTTARPDTVRFFNWNYNNNTYQLIGTYHFTYDATGEYVTHMVLTNTSGGTTITYVEAFMNYTPEGYLIGYQLYTPGGTGSLELNSTMQIDYTSTSNYEIWDWVAQNEDLVPEWRHTTFEWDTPGRITLETIQTSTDSVSWVNYEQISHAYHAGDTTTGDSFVSGFSHQLPLMMIGDYNGPFYGKELESYTKSWNNNQWVNRYKQNFDYNANLVLLSDIEYKWQGATWINKGKNDYIYDANNNLTEDVYCIWSGGTWINDQHFVYDYSAYTANSDPTTVPVLMNLSAYPNPFHQSDAVTFETKLSANETGTITIYNLKGQIVKTLPVKAGSSQLVWDSNQRNCAAGVYLYRLSTNKHEVTKKLVILN
jgi:hypothetical protein